MGAGLLLVSWILRASLISVILEESKFSLAAVPGSEDLNVNVTKRQYSVHRPSILAWVRKSINRRRFEKARTKLRVALGSETQTFFCARFANTLALRARRNTTRCRKEQNVFRQTPVLSSILKTGPYHLRTSLLQGQDRVKGLLKLIQGNVLGLIRSYYRWLLKRSLKLVLTSLSESLYSVQ